MIQQLEVPQKATSSNYAVKLVVKLEHFSYKEDTLKYVRLVIKLSKQTFSFRSHHLMIQPQQNTCPQGDDVECCRVFKQSVHMFSLLVSSVILSYKGSSF
jgi:hypothetical protein